MSENLRGFVTRKEAEALWMPKWWRYRACDRTARGYLDAFSITPHPMGRFSRIDLLQMASAHDAWMAGEGDIPDWLPIEGPERPPKSADTRQPSQLEGTQPAPLAQIGARALAKVDITPRLEQGVQTNG